MGESVAFLLLNQQMESSMSIIRWLFWTTEEGAAVLEGHFVVLLFLFTFFNILSLVFFPHLFVSCIYHVCILFLHIPLDVVM